MNAAKIIKKCCLSIGKCYSKAISNYHISKYHTILNSTFYKNEEKVKIFGLLTYTLIPNPGHENMTNCP
jgi:hypothetical protein